MINELLKQNPQLLDKYGSDYIKVLTSNLIKAGKKASSKLINSLSYDIKELTIEIYGEDYLDFVDQGVDGRWTSYGSPFRFTNKMPPVSEIAKWCSIKGISEKAAFPIARKIFNFGIEPTYVIEQTNKEVNIDESILISNIEDWLLKKYNIEND
jgi:hypothetical protein